MKAGNVGVAYSQQLTYTGGSGTAVTWAILSGSLPAGSGLTRNLRSSRQRSRHLDAHPGNNSVLYLISPTKALLLDLTTTTPTIVELTHQ